MPNNKEQKPLKADIASFDNFLEDMFGLNIKGLKTLWICFINPKRYYQAAWSTDWEGKYTPSFRLWFTIMAITFFFQFFWGGHDSSMIESFANQIEKNPNPLPDGVSPKTAAIVFSKWSLGFLPIANAITLLTLSGIYFAWNRKTPFTVRQRNIFATIIPSTAILLFLMMFQRTIKAEHILTFTAIVSVLTIIIDGITAYRGAFADANNTGRLWRSCCLAIAIVIAGIIALLISQVFAMTAIAISYS